MTQAIPVVTTTLGASPEIAAQVRHGLATGTYERLGGVIRRVDNKQVVAWLREVSPDANVAPILEQIGPLVPFLGGSAFSLLHLSITVVSVVAVMKQLDGLAKQLKGMQTDIGTIHRKLDLNFTAHLESGLKVARKAIGMQENANRYGQLHEAIPRLLEAEERYLGLLDMELDQGQSDVALYLSSLVLLHTTTVGCYLALGETGTAHDHLAERCQALKERVQRYHALVIGSSPALYLHPELAKEISLTRLTQLLRYQEPRLTEVEVFERFREAIWEMARQNPKDWQAKLPFSMRNQPASRVRKVGEAIKETIDKSIPSTFFPLLADAFKQVEQAQLALAYLEGFESELAYLVTHRIPLQEWQKLPAPETDPDASLWWVLPRNSELSPVSVAG